MISAVEAFVREHMNGDTTGHDWWHVDRVRKTALLLQQAEGGDVTVIELAALLHDISDHKFNGGDYERGSKIARQLLRDTGYAPEIAAQVGEIIERVSYSSNRGPMTTVEGKIVQDADRLDAIGAIGIARCFATGCKLGRPIFDPTQPHHSIGHFHDKLLRLKDGLHTDEAKKIASRRHERLEVFLKNFAEEWGV